MELDATEKRQQQLSKEELDRRRKEQLCFNCGKAGHRSKECRSPRKGANGGTPRRSGTKELRATREINEIVQPARGAYDMSWWPLDATDAQGPTEESCIVQRSQDESDYPRIPDNVEEATRRLANSPQMFSKATEKLLNATRYDEDWEERQFQDPEISDSEDSEH
ncbi:C2HC-type zinc finger protein, partial [Aspergillus affinis]|uniref:C2HC-type zinc finger protein n=1 Tax=Aspergillus affinis TaxID=1070780 RepID=UPI0022FF0121